MVESLSKTVEELKEKIAVLEGGRTNAVAPSATASTTNQDTARHVLEGNLELPAGIVPNQKPLTRDFGWLKDEQWSAPRPRNASLDPELKQFTRLFGTENYLRLEVVPRTDAIVDTSKVGDPDAFKTATIPVSKTGNDQDERATMQAKASRLSLEMRRPTDLGPMRVYYENDFFGSSGGEMDYNLRNLYGQLGPLVVGYTLTTLADPDAIPDTLDYQGPNSLVYLYSPQFRLILPLVGQAAHRLNLAIAIEEPEPATGLPGDVVCRWPDCIGVVRYENPRLHLQAGSVFRSISIEGGTSDDMDALGWGITTSGALIPFGNDVFLFWATYGEGISRYIQDANGTAPDAVIDADGNIQAVPLIGCGGGYTHFWTKRWRSTASYGYFSVDPFGLNKRVPNFTTHYASLNLIWKLNQFASVGTECLYGRKVQGGEGDAVRIQMAIQLDFEP